MRRQKKMKDGKQQVENTQETIAGGISQPSPLHYADSYSLSTLAHLCNDTRPPGHSHPAAARSACTGNNLGNVDASDYAFLTTHYVSKAWDRSNRPMHSLPKPRRTVSPNFNGCLACSPLIRVPPYIEFRPPNHYSAF